MLHLDIRIFSSLLEISHCTRLAVYFGGPAAAAPAIIQIDPKIHSLEIYFEPGCDPSTFIVAPRQAEGVSLGLSDIRVVVSGHGSPGESTSTCLLVDAKGVNNVLLVSAAGRRGEQYKIELRQDVCVGGDGDDEGVQARSRTRR